MEDNKNLLKVSDDLLMELLRFKSKNPEFTFSLRKTDRYQRLTSGHWFQGSHYIFCPLFKRGDGKHKTNNIGFVIDFDDEQNIKSYKIEIVKKADNYSELELKLLNSLVEWLGIEWNDNETAAYYFKNETRLDQNLDFFLNEFRDKCLQLLNEFDLEKQYLVTHKEFYKSLSRIGKIRSELGFGSHSYENEYKTWFLEIKSEATWDTYRQALTQVLKVYISSNEFLNDISLPPEIYFSVFYVKDAELIKSLINQFGEITHFVPNSPRSKFNYDHLMSALRNYEAFLNSDPKIKPKAKQMNQINQPLNQILYGPPGTGKTYKTTELAVKITEPEKYKSILDSNETKEEKRDKIKKLYDELVVARRIGFTTFHQSYAYEDFIEGIRVDSEELEEKNISYKVEDGVFKELVALANGSHAEGAEGSKGIDVTNRNIWKMSLGDTSKGNEKYQNCIEKSYIGMNYGKDIDFSGAKSKNEIIKTYQENSEETFSTKDYAVTSVHRFKNEMKKNDLIIVTDGNRKFRAIGEVTGDYECNQDDDYLFYQTRPVNWLRVFETSLPKDPLFLKGISQMTLYRLNSDTINLSHLDALLNKAKETKNHVLIIDEINRGNVSRIFGELITLLETDKRQGGSDSRTAILPYSKDTLSVPDNLYIIGTMNTADKSLAQMDLALRRRFEFVEMMPEPQLLLDVEVSGVSVMKLLEVINARIEVLLDRDHLIGHSYFWSLINLNDEPEDIKLKELAGIFKKKIIPLLQEYFFADWEKISWVLNDTNKDTQNQFIWLDNNGDMAVLFGPDISDKLQDRRYRINNDAFMNPDAYNETIQVE